MWRRPLNQLLIRTKKVFTVSIVIWIVTAGWITYTLLAKY